MTSGIGIYDVTENNDGSVTAFIYVSTWKNEVGGSFSGATDVHRVELIPTDGAYVVIADEILTMSEYADYPYPDLAMPPND
ncbi:MAG: hypothetical protein Q4A82_06275 [Corynebacterium sp.]|nr:hypothetical protein [Corynebacterium sp.]